MTARPTLLIAHAGVVGGVLERQILPAFRTANGCTVECVAGHSVSLARKIAAGELRPDLYISADAEVNRLVFADGVAAPWFVTFAGVAMALICSPRSRFKAALAEEDAESTPWFEVVQRPGFVLKRNPPNDDPGGYRAVFVAQLAELHYGVPGLARTILGTDDNPAQTSGGGLAALEEGAVDAMLAYATLARERGLPYVTLPDAINLGNADFAAAYARASFTTRDGHVFRGTPARLSVTIPRTAANPADAEALIASLLSRECQARLAAHGFLPAPFLLGGAPDAAPAILQALCAGRYAA